MENFDDMTIAEIAQMVDEDIYASEEPEDFDFIGDDYYGEEDTVIRMILEAQ